LNTYEVLSVFAGITYFALAIAWYIVSERCPICNYDLSTMKPLEEEKKDESHAEQEENMSLEVKWLVIACALSESPRLVS
jgi:uncharacterized protein YqfB (UPF0267 family)